MTNTTIGITTKARITWNETPEDGPTGSELVGNLEIVVTEEDDDGIETVVHNLAAPVSGDHSLIRQRIADLLETVSLQPVEGEDTDAAVFLGPVDREGYLVAYDSPEVYAGRFETTWLTQASYGSW